MGIKLLYYRITHLHLFFCFVSFFSTNLPQKFFSCFINLDDTTKTVKVNAVEDIFFQRKPKLGLAIVEKERTKEQTTKQINKQTNKQTKEQANKRMNEGRFASSVTS